MTDLTGGEARAFTMGLEVENDLPPGSLQAINEHLTGWRGNLPLLPLHRQGETDPDRLNELTQGANRFKLKLEEFDGIMPLALDAYYRGDKATKQSLSEGWFDQSAADDVHSTMARMPKYGGQEPTELETEATSAVIGEPSKDLEKVRSAPIPKPVRPVQLKQDKETGSWSTGDAFFDAVMHIESRGDTNAVSPTGAAGLFQFTIGTGEQYGLIKRNSAGKIIQDLRKDPAANFNAMKRLTADNAKALKRAGIEPTPGALYMAHQQGIGGTKEILRAIKNGTDVPPKIRKNMNLNNGKGKTPAQFYAMFTNKVKRGMNGAGFKSDDYAAGGTPTSGSAYAGGPTSYNNEGGGVNPIDEMMAQIPTTAAAEVAAAAGDDLLDHGDLDDTVDEYGREVGSIAHIARLDDIFKIEKPTSVPPLISEALRGIIGSV